MTTATLAPRRAPVHSDAHTIALVGLAHGTSHFFALMLPTLFPLFKAEFGLDYAQLGLLVTTFFVVSGLGQATSGFLVDRIGARPVLFAALSCFCVAALLVASAGSYHGLIAAAALAGFGNSPFHPVDYTILNKRVSQPRLGHAFAVHGITGNLGWAVAPVYLTGLNALSGSWRVAATGAAVLVLAVIATLWFNREAVDDRAEGARELKGPAAASATVSEHPMAFLKLPSVWLCFSFFFWSTCALSAIQSFSSPALQRMYGLPLSITAFVVTAYMLAGVAGMVLGGFIAGKADRLEKIVAASLLASAAMLGCVAMGVLPGLMAAGLTALAGFGIGLAGPSRDMLIKRAAPPNATGRVYGMVYSGLDLGFAVSAPVFGALMDHGTPPMIFVGAALALVMGVGSASIVGLRVQRAKTAPAVRVAA
jgi:MFS transporter, FSR family, fosmidomycin resistance protein